MHKRITIEKATFLSSLYTFHDASYDFIRCSTQRPFSINVTYIDGGRKRPG